MKYHKRRSGLAQRQKMYDSSKQSPSNGSRRPGSLKGSGPTTTERYRRGIGSKRSQQAISLRGA